MYMKTDAPVGPAAPVAPPEPVAPVAPPEPVAPPAPIVKDDILTSDYLLADCKKIVKKQPFSGPCCAFAYAAGLTIVTGKKYDGMTFYKNGSAHYTKGHVGGYTKPSFSGIGNSLLNKKMPVMLHYKWSPKGEHWVLAVGLKAGADPKNLKAKDIIVLDSATGKQVTLNKATCYSKSKLAGMKYFK
jgi:hypothetical protein